MIDSLGVIETINGVEIHATSGGKFAAIIGGKVVRLANLLALKRRLQLASAPLICMEVHSLAYGAERRTVTRVTEAGRVYHLVKDWGNSVRETNERIDGWYFLDEEVLERLNAIGVQAKALEQERRELIGRLAPLRYAAYMKAQQELAEEAAAAEATQIEERGDGDGGA